MTDPLVSALSKDDLLKYPDSYHVACFLERPGLQDFLKHIEFTYYPPGTEENDLYDIRLVAWPVGGGQKPLYVVFSFPKIDLPKISEDARKFGLLIRDRCIPVRMAIAGLESRFPILGSLKPENVQVWRDQGYIVTEDFPLVGVNGTIERDPNN